MDNNCVSIVAEIYFSTTEIYNYNTLDSITDPPKLTVIVRDNNIMNEIDVRSFGAAGDGYIDDTAAIQNAINSVKHGSILFPPGKYKVSNNLLISSNINIRGDCATIFCDFSWANGAAFFVVSNGANILISGMTFDAKGTWTNYSFENPYQPGDSVGFTNNHVGILIANQSSNISVSDNKFYGMGRGGVVCDLVDYLNIHNNSFYNCGAQGIYLERCNSVDITKNVIQNILGQLTLPGDINIASSNVGDGIYIRKSKYIKIRNNYIENVVRIGIVLEGDGITLNKHISIIDNTIKLVQNSRGTEYNAAIWSEYGKSESSCLVSGNDLDNTNATLGTNTAYGVWAYYCKVIGNSIKNFDGQGIGGHGYTAIGNTLESNGFGISIASQSVDLITQVEGNLIYSSKSSGVSIYKCRGTVNIISNIICDNGVSATAEYYKCGIEVSYYYNNQNLLIAHNTFISSANEGDESGQLYGIVGRRGGDYAYDAGKTIVGNTFLFKGLFAGNYPNNMNKKPCTYAYNDSYLGLYNIIEISSLGKYNNVNEKELLESVNARKFPTIAGFSSDVPTKGSYIEGDFIYNKDYKLGEPIGWICKASGNPGKWQVFL